jgi:hypothetical protein
MEVSGSNVELVNIVVCFLRAIFGIHNIKDGTTCEISSKLWDVHDFYESKGGDGYPAHFMEYTCPNCGKKFSI